MSDEAAPEAPKPPVTVSLVIDTTEVSIQVPMAQIEALYDVNSDAVMFALLQAAIKPALKQLIDSRFPELFDAMLESVQAQLLARKQARLA